MKKPKMIKVPVLTIVLWTLGAFLVGYGLGRILGGVQ